MPLEISPEIDFCDGHPCGIHGVCYNTTESWICKCTSGFTGDNCSIGEKESKKETQKDFPKICLNKYSSIKRLTNFQYLFYFPYYLPLEISPDIDHCAGDPCGIHGVCYNTTDGWICKCTSGFTGDNCTIGEKQCKNR